jgi:hypothetical protein
VGAASAGLWPLPGLGSWQTVRLLAPDEDTEGDDADEKLSHIHEQGC